MSVNAVPGNVVLTVKNGVAYVEIRRPHRHNALDSETANALLDRCREIEHDDLVRAVVLCGQGASFGVGGDLRELKSDSPRSASRIIAALHAAVSILIGLDAPVIGKLRGNVAGGSMSLSLACDLVVASANTKFKLAYTNLATTADLGGSWHLPHIVGLRNAMEIALLNEAIDAKRARELGLVNRVVADEELDEEVDHLAQKLASGPTKAFGRMKRQLREALGNDIRRQLGVEMVSFVECAKGGEFHEAVNAILEKRSPRFIET